MALIDLSKVDPWGKTQEARRAANARVANSVQQAATFISDTVAQNKARRDALTAQNEHFRNQEYALINKNTDQLVQPQTNSKITDLELQKTGQKIKQEYYDAVKTYQASDKSDEARAEFEQAKQKALGSARTISAALTNLNTATTTFEKAWNTGGISDAMNPAVRQFMIDLVNPQSEAQIQIVTDPETGQLKYQGQTSTGDPVDFFLEDVANGDNVFEPIPKADMPSIIMNLTKGLKADMIQEKREDGSIVAKTNWDALGVQLDSRIDTILQDETKFRAIAAGEGYGWDAFSALKNGEPYEELDAEGNVVNTFYNFDELKAQVSRDIKDKIETVLPHQEEVVYDPNKQPTLLEQQQSEDLVDNQRSINQQVQTAIKDNDLEYFRTSLIGTEDPATGKPIQEVKIKDGKLQLIGISGSNKPFLIGQYDTDKLGDQQRLTELFGGNRSVAQQVERANKFKSQL